MTQPHQNYLTPAPRLKLRTASFLYTDIQELARHKTQQEKKKNTKKRKHSPSWMRE